MSDIGVLALVKLEYTDKSGWKIRPGLITGEYLNDYQVTFINKEIDKYKHESTSIIIDNNDFASGRLKKRSVVRALAKPYVGAHVVYKAEEYKPKFQANVYTGKKCPLAKCGKDKEGVKGRR